MNRKLFTDSGKKYQRISLKTGEEVPEPQDIISCYPNPFNPQLTISYTLAESIDNLEIHIYNAKGQIVRTIESSALTSGTNSVIWNGDNDSGKMVSSGVYFINMHINDKLYTKKAILMK